MVKRSHRLLYTILALMAGIGIVLLLTYLGSQSKGPLAHFFDKAGDMVTRMENDLLTENRSVRRKDKLVWLNSQMTREQLIKKSGPVLLGAYDNTLSNSFEGVIALEDSLRTVFHLIHIYMAWGDKSEEQFPLRQVEAITGLGSIPVITWEPWLTDFSSEKHPQLRKPEYRDKGGMADVARGKYDFYIKAWAEEAAKMNTLIFLRVGHEMNDPYRYPWGPQNNTPKEYVAAWRHIHQVFQKAGATKILWIWSPHPSYGWFDAFYPGKNYVDYVGINVLNYGTAVTWSQWWTFDEIFGNHYKELAKFQKPMMVTELGCLVVGGSRPEWFDKTFGSIPGKYPLVRSMLFFHFSNDMTTTQKAVDWTIKSDPATRNAIIRRMNAWPDSIKPVIKKL